MGCGDARIPFVNTGSNFVSNAYFPAFEYDPFIGKGKRK